MRKEYEIIELCGSIDDSVNKLLGYRRENKLACGNFNGQILYSDTVTLDDAYVSITGHTKEDLDKLYKEKMDEHDRL